jgi:hypothetical protein
MRALIADLLIATLVRVAGKTALSGAGTVLTLGSTTHTRTALAAGVFHLPVLTAAPASPAQGDLALADRATWDPLSKGFGGPYLVWYNGAAWVAPQNQ